MGIEGPIHMAHTRWWSTRGDQATERREVERQTLAEVARRLAEVELSPATHQGAYVPRSEYGRRLDEHFEGSGAPLVIVGEPGSGKSALLSR